MPNLLRHRLNDCINFVRTWMRPDCVLCGGLADGTMLCAPCLASLPRASVAACPRCGVPSGGALCGACLRDPPAFDRTVAALVYEFPVDKLVQALKYGQRLALARLLGLLLAERVAGAPRPDVLIPMPLHPARLAERGFNQALEIGRVLSRRLGLPLKPTLAARQRDTAVQAALPLNARRRNVKGAFVCTTGVRERHVALVDDVMTSGATVNELAQAARAAGAREVSVWVVARALPQR